MKTSICGLRRELMGLWLLLALMPAKAMAAPGLYGDFTLGECRQMNSLANAAYLSKKPSLMGAVEVPKDFPSTVVLHPSALGADPIAADPTLFRKFETPAMKAMGFQRIYWQITAGRWRIVQTEQSFNGKPMYNTTYVKPTITPDQFAEHFKSHPGVDDDVKSVYSAQRPPRLLRDNSTGVIWNLDDGGVDGYMASIYVQDWPLDCYFNFDGPTTRTEDMFPTAVQKYLDQVARIAVSVNGGLSAFETSDSAELNALVRPWAMADQAPNIQATIDAGLKPIITTAGKDAATWRRALRLQRPAEAAMASYYTAKFGINAGAAKAMAHYALDIMFRASFTFAPSPQDKQPRASLNPWPGVIVPPQDRPATGDVSSSPYCLESGPRPAVFCGYGLREDDRRDRVWAYFAGKTAPDEMLNCGKVDDCPGLTRAFLARAVQFENPMLRVMSPRDPRFLALLPAGVNYQLGASGILCGRNCINSTTAVGPVVVYDIPSYKGSGLHALRVEFYGMKSDDPATPASANMLAQIADPATGAVDDIGQTDDGPMLDEGFFRYQGKEYRYSISMVDKRYFVLIDEEDPGTMIQGIDGAVGFYLN